MRVGSTEAIRDSKAGVDDGLRWGRRLAGGGGGGGARRCGSGAVAGHARTPLGVPGTLYTIPATAARSLSLRHGAPFMQGEQVAAVARVGGGEGSGTGCACRRQTQKERKV